jgi:hypothetical protein
MNSAATAWHSASMRRGVERVSAKWQNNAGVTSDISPVEA